MAKRDYYEILGVPRNANADEIKKAHRKLVRQFHPDVNKNNKQSEEKFKEVQEAYDVLSDPEKKQRYDQFGHAGVSTGSGPAGVDPFESFRRGQGGRAGAGRGGQQWRGGPNVTVEDFDSSDFNSGQFSEIFEQLFGGRGGGAGPGAGFGGGFGGAAGGPRGRSSRSASIERGADVEYPVTLSFEQAARGTTLSLQINRGGTMENIEIKIPPGVKDGSRVRIKGKGEQGPGGGGDLFIITKVIEHQYYRRDGLDIIIDLPISLYEAMLGTKIAVPTLDGPVTLTIPPSTSSHAKLRIKDRGIFRGDEKGDQLVIIKIIVPKDLDAEEKKTFEKLAAKHPVNARADLKW